MQVNKAYSISFDNLSKHINNYIEHGGEAVQIDEGVLGDGTWIMFSPDNRLYSYVSWENPLNEWSTQQLIRKYKQLPKKYMKMLQDFWDRTDED